MATSATPRLGLARPLVGHQFSRAEYFNVLTLLDGYPGEYICTSGSRPGGWGAKNVAGARWGLPIPTVCPPRFERLLFIGNRTPIITMRTANYRLATYNFTMGG